MNPQISIIVPVYKVEPYIRRCLDSIISQTFIDWECILVDDGSPDNCGKICDEYAKKDSRIIIIHKDNGGLSSARNAALDIAKGDYIMFVDSDDWVESDFCEVAMDNLIKKKADIVVFGLNNIYYDNLEIVKTESHFTSRPRYVSISEAIKELITKEDVICNFVWNKIYKRTLFNGIRFPVGREYEDQATTYLLMMKAQTIFVSDEILYNYVKRIDSISGIWYKPKAIVDRFEIWLKRLDDIINHCPENELLQIKQLGNEAIEGLMRINKESEYGYILDEFRSFLAKYKKDILIKPCSIKIKLYYLSESWLYLYKYVRMIIRKIR